MNEQCQNSCNYEDRLETNIKNKNFLSEIGLFTRIDKFVMWEPITDGIVAEAIGFFNPNIVNYIEGGSHVE